jgi:signal transduction histidine kinase
MSLFAAMPNLLGPMTSGSAHDRVPDGRASGTPEQVRNDLAAPPGEEKTLHKVSDLLKYAAYASPNRFRPRVAVIAETALGELGKRVRRRTRAPESLARQLLSIAEVQVAVRRVAALIARGVAPGEVFAAVTAEVGRLLDADNTSMIRYDPDRAGTVVGAWTSTGAAGPVSVGSRVELGGRNLAMLVSETGQPASADADASGEAADLARWWGIRSAVGVPISVEGRLWGLISAVSTSERPLPADSAVRLAGFTELVATAVANAQARLELRGCAEEQAALRRVATLVARAAPPGEVLSAVAAEVGRLLHADQANVVRYDPDRAATVVGAWSDAAAAVPVGIPVGLGGRNVTTLVFETGQPARIDDYADASGPVADIARAWSAHGAVGVPIGVEGRLWGVMVVVSTHAQPLPADTEARLAGFTELAATALANAEAQAALAASRARIVAAADAARRGIERDLHDGAQQRLVSLALQLQAAQTAVPPGADELAARLDELMVESTSALDELRELARGIHPAILAERGLPPALKTLARRSAVPVELDVRADRRLPEPIETATYYLVAEALTNAVKHAQASVIYVEVDIADGADAAGEVLRVCVRDDGCGGAHPAGGSGLVGLKDRVEALGGRLGVQTAPGAGTAVRAELPLGTAAADCAPVAAPRR